MLITAMLGNYFSAGLNMRYAMLKKINYMLDEIAILLRYKSSTVYEILEHISKDERFYELDFINTALTRFNVQESFGLTWEKAVENSSITCLQKEDRLLLKSIGKNLGKSDLEGQLSTVMLEKEELSALIEASQTAYLTKSKLYRTLGVLSGAFISVMIL